MNDTHELIEARKAIPNGGRIFITAQGTTDKGVGSFHVYAAKITRAGNVLLNDVTSTLKAIPGADGKFRGRPRHDAVLRAQGSEDNPADKVLVRQVADALYGDSGKLTAQSL